MFILVTIILFRVCFVLDHLMGPQPGWERTSYSSSLQRRPLGKTRKDFGAGRQRDGHAQDRAVGRAAQLP